MRINIRINSCDENPLVKPHAIAKAVASRLKNETKKSDIFHISQNIDFGYSLEPLRRGGSNEYPQSMFLSKK